MESYLKPCVQFVAEHRSLKEFFRPRKSILFFAIMLLSAFISLAKSFCFAKVLTPSAFGFLAIFNTVAGYSATLMHFGLLNGLNRELPVTLGRGQGSRAIALRNMVLKLIFLSFFIILVPYTLGLYFWGGGGQRDSYIAALVGAYIAAFAISLYQLAALELRSRLMLIEFSASTLFQNALALGAGVLLGRILGVSGVILAVILSYLCLVALVWRIWGKNVAFGCIDFKEIKVLLKIGTPLVVSLFCFNLITTMDKLFVGRFFGSEELGLYHFAGLVVSGGLVLNGIIGQWLMPQVLVDHGKGLAPRRNLLRLFGIMGIIGCLFVVGWYPMKYLLTYLIQTHFSEYFPAIEYVPFFYFSAALMNMNLAGTMLNALNRQVLIMEIGLTTTVVLGAFYIISAKAGLPIRSFAQIYLGGQALLFLLNTIFAYRTVNKEVVNASSVLEGK